MIPEKEVRTVTWETHSEEETELLGQRLAKTLRPGQVLALEGDLGAGKTAFVRGLAAGLGCPGRVSSPTFTIVNEYEGGRLPLFHFDLYRLKSPRELDDLGWEDYVDRGGICAVEWSSNGGDALGEVIPVTITRLSDTARKITIPEVELC